MTKARAGVDLWLQDVALSSELRKWFRHDPAKWKKFERRYWKELQGHEDAVDLLRKEARKRAVTLVYAGKDEQHIGALALKESIEQRKR